MMKIIAIFLSNLVLLQSLHIDLKDINKINVLIEHAQFHQEKYGDSFVEFLYEHYIDQEISENQQHQEHENLPFKEGVHHFNHIDSVLELNSGLFELVLPNKIISKNTFFYKESYTTFEKASIFQPPKLSQFM